MRNDVSYGKWFRRAREPRANCSMAAFCCRRMQVRKACGIPTQPLPRRWASVSPPSTAYDNSSWKSFEAALSPQRPLRRPDNVTIKGEVEQHVLALACGEPPRGHGRWTVRLLADRMVALG